MECEISKRVLPPFLLKTYMVVDDPVTDAVISWNDDGTAFVVWQPAEFAADLLPTLFKHRNFSSFVRQLNTYGFRKVATKRWEFRNEIFRKGKRDQLCKIWRRKSASNKPKPNVQVLAAAAAKEHSDNEETSTSSSELTNQQIIVDENKRLKQENGVLIYELNAIKKKRNQLLHLVSLYEQEQQGCSDGGLKLFGVRLQVGYNNYKF